MSSCQSFAVERAVWGDTGIDDGDADAATVYGRITGAAGSYAVRRQCPV